MAPTDQDDATLRGMEEGADHPVVLRFPLIAGHERQPPGVVVEPPRHRSSSESSTSSCQMCATVSVALLLQLPILPPVTLGNSSIICNS
jgi:hypothetical protein